MNMQEMAEGQPRPARNKGLLHDVCGEHQQLVAVLREALKEATEAIDNGERFLEPSCNECTEGSTPIQFDHGLCWVHKARKLIGEAR